MTFISSQRPRDNPMKHRLREAKGPGQGHTAGEWRSTQPANSSKCCHPQCSVLQVLSAGTRQVGRGWRLRSQQGWEPLTSLSPSRATAEPEAGGDYVKVRGAGQGTLRGPRASSRKGRVLFWPRALATSDAALAPLDPLLGILSLRWLLLLTTLLHLLFYFLPCT